MREFREPFVATTQQAGIKLGASKTHHPAKVNLATDDAMLNDHGVEFQVLVILLIGSRRGGSFTDEHLEAIERLSHRQHVRLTARKRWVITASGTRLVEAMARLRNPIAMGDTSNRPHFLH